jgi:hypothetical protein
MRGAVSPPPLYTIMAWCSVKKAQGPLFITSVHLLKIICRFLNRNIIHQVPRLRVHGAVPPIHHTSSWYDKGKGKGVPVLFLNSTTP